MTGPSLFRKLSPSSLEIPKQDQQRKSYNHGSSHLLVPDNSSAPWGEGGSEFGRISDYSHYEKVATGVFHMVEYPPQLAYRKIGGVVQSRIVMNKDGQCEWGKSYIKGNSPYLRFYILTVLKQFCKGDIWHRLKNRKSSNLDFSFSFDTFSDKETPPIVNGNVITFRLPGYQHEANWNLGPLSGNFLVPTSIFLNTIWIVENWNSLIHDEDPLARFKEKEEK